MLLTLAFLFSVGSICGWGLEVLFRRFFSAHHWVNPGFLVGPYLPLYGFSLCVLYLLAGLEPLIPMEETWIRKLLLFLLMAVAITLLEYIAGVIFIRGMKIKLWDYSDRWGNINGIICPLFSFFWMVLSALYYFLIHPYILSALHWLSENLAFSFVIGFFYGIFVLDVAYSTQLMVKIRAFATESGIVVLLEELREDIHNAFSKRQNQKKHFFFPLRVGIPLRELLEKYQSMHYESKKNLQKRLRSRKH